MSSGDNSMVGKLWFWSQKKEKYRALMEKAMAALLEESPLGTNLASVIETLKRQNYEFSGLLDGEGVLEASYQSRFNDLTWRTGPASWDLVLYCRFEAGELREVEARMRPTGL